jgi:hypothetical protein
MVGRKLRNIRIDNNAIMLPIVNNPGKHFSPSPGKNLGHHSNWWFLNQPRGNCRQYSYMPIAAAVAAL